MSVLYCRDTATGRLWVKSEALNRAMGSTGANSYTRIVKPLLRRAPWTVSAISQPHYRRPQHRWRR
jgi:hypothetical protein